MADRRDKNARRSETKSLLMASPVTSKLSVASSSSSCGTSPQRKSLTESLLGNEHSEDVLLSEDDSSNEDVVVSGRSQRGPFYPSLLSACLIDPVTALRKRMSKLTTLSYADSGNSNENGNSRSTARRKRHPSAKTVKRSAQVQQKNNLRGDDDKLIVADLCNTIKFTTNRFASGVRKPREDGTVQESAVASDDDLFHA